MRELKIIWVRIRAALHHYWTYHYHQVVWYNGPGYEEYNAIWKMNCKNCPRIFYVDETIDKFIKEQIQKEKLAILENEAVKSRMN